MIPLSMTCPTLNFMSWTIAYRRIVSSFVIDDRCRLGFKVTQIKLYQAFGIGFRVDIWKVVDECKTHLCFEFISRAILSILYPYSCKTHKISSKLGFEGLLMKNK